MELMVDVRTREEFVKKHVKGAINIPLHDMHFYIPFLSSDEIDKIRLYCDTGRRANLAMEILKANNIEAEIIEPDKLEEYEMEGNDIICAVNFVSVRHGNEDEFEKIVVELCNKTNRMEGFLGSKILRVDGISAIGSGLPGEMKNEEIKPAKYIILTYWKSKEAHENSHATDLFREIFGSMPEYLTKYPYEEFYGVVK